MSDESQNSETSPAPSRGKLQMPDPEVVRKWSREEWEAFYQSDLYAALMVESWESKKNAEPFVMD